MNVIVIKLISIKGLSEETKIMGNFYTFKHSRAINLNLDEEALLSNIENIILIDILYV